MNAGKENRLERSMVRVTIYQSNILERINSPLQVFKFEDNSNILNSYVFNVNDAMATVTTIPNYNRQQSTDSGWDNPFRPGGDLSREADEIVNMIRGGKPITPTEEEDFLRNGNPKFEDNCSSSIIDADVNQLNISQNQSALNGMKSTSVQSAVMTKAPVSTESNGSSVAQVSKKVVPGPASASHIMIDEKKNSNKGCCLIQ
ncbi:uncharacterized protein LOC129237796 isoform X2 [Anastrepha obliqua]|uniref:uncharacterized protein LOC129237796 isoform X2 n=1 Tax=Anastrepha obliqua TaxID=95512 RepID=UPI00240A678F|nr:uncharacterized protein LOC129237796 isoform X2 [Anastrepha obliqua]